MILDSYGLFLDDDLSHKSTSALVNNIDNNIPVNEDDKFEHIENNNLEQNINEDNLNNESNNTLINEEDNNIEKLPFLGENIKENEKSKIYNYINYLFDCDWLFFIWI